MTYETKRCPSCKQTLPKTAFSKNAGRPDGISAACKPCNIAYQKKHRQVVQAKVKAYDKAMALLEAKRRAEAQP